MLTVLANGLNARWSSTVPKVLYQYRGEPLILRTIRLFEALTGQRAIVPCWHCEVVKALDGRELRVGETTSAKETLLRTRSLWDSHNWALLGDVYYTDAAAQKIVACKESLAFFGSWKQRELFAITWWDSIKLAEALEQPGHFNRLWDAYAYASGQKVAVPGPLLRLIEDETTDFDVQP